MVSDGSKPFSVITRLAPSQEMRYRYSAVWETSCQYSLTRRLRLSSGCSWRLICGYWLRRSLTTRAQARGAGHTRQPATSLQTEGAITRCLQRFIRLLLYLSNLTAHP